MVEHGQAGQLRRSVGDFLGILVSLFVVGKLCSNKPSSSNKLALWVHRNSGKHTLFSCADVISCGFRKGSVFPPSHEQLTTPPRVTQPYANRLEHAQIRKRALAPRSAYSKQCMLVIHMCGVLLIFSPCSAYSTRSSKQEEDGGPCVRLTCANANGNGRGLCS